MVHQRQTNDPRHAYRAEQLWSNYDFTKAQKDLDEVRVKSNADMRKTQNIGIDPETLEEINWESMNREKYLKRQTSEIIADLDQVKKFIRLRQEDYVRENYDPGQLDTYLKFIRHLDSETVISVDERLTQEELNLASSIINDPSFISQRQIYSDSSHRISSDILLVVIQ